MSTEWVSTSGTGFHVYVIDDEDQDMRKHEDCACDWLSTTDPIRILTIGVNPLCPMHGKQWRANYGGYYNESVQENCEFLFKWQHDAIWHAPAVTAKRPLPIARML